MTWDDFVIRFMVEYAPTIDVKKLSRESPDLCQTTETMAEITAMFKEMDLLVMQYVIDEEMKKNIYQDMLRDDIQEFVSISSCKTLEDIISRSWERDIDLSF